MAKMIKREITGILKTRERGEEQGRSISGTAIVFDTPATLYSDDEREIREVISHEAITRELLDRSDIKMTLFHNRERILARSVNGKGTLSYNVTERGVDFAFEAPESADGDYALEAVSRGDLSGCSFAFGIIDEEASIDRAVTREGDKDIVTYTVRSVDGIFDFTIAADPAYPTTEVSASNRSYVDAEREIAKRADEEREKAKADRVASQVKELREMSNLNF